MSKSTGNFLTLMEAVAKFSADGEFDLLYLPMSMSSIGIVNMHIYSYILTMQICKYIVIY